MLNLLKLLKEFIESLETLIHQTQMYDYCKQIRESGGNVTNLSDARRFRMSKVDKTIIAIDSNLY